MSSQSYPSIETKRAVKLKDGTTLPKGSKAWFLKKDNGDWHNTVCCVEGHLVSIVGAFGPAPKIETMEKWSNDGVAKSVTGRRVEPDGHGPDGSPSWLLVMNVI